VNARADLVFTDAKGRDNNRQQKAAEKALAALQSVLPRLMGPNEVVLAIGFAQTQPSIFEQYFLGWSVFFIGRACLVVTNRGLLRFRIRSTGWAGWTWDNGVQGIGWGDLAEVRKRGIGNRYLTLRYRSGGKEKLWRMQATFCKKVVTLAPLLLNANLAESTPAAGPISLCPKCLAPLAAGVYRCPQCGQVFRDEKKLFWRTLLIPGGEFFYVRLAGWGILQALVEIVLLVAVIGLLADAVTSSGSDAETNVAAAGLIFLIWVVHKLAAHAQCRRVVRTFLPID
jgi:hypothetical protein